MPIRLDSIIKKKLVQRSERVKCTDLHPIEPWLLAGLYSGHLHIYNFETEKLVKSFEVVKVPIRSSKFIARKHWVVCGSDDFFIRVYNYNTMGKVAEFEAHTDYIRSLAVHPTLPYFLSTSDDFQVKLWDWSRDFENTQLFEGHHHFVMMAQFNPKDPNYFATASLDKTVRVWCLGQPTPNFALEGHTQGVNCVSYYSGGDQPYILSGSDDQTIKLWDYQTKACVATLTGHTNNVAAVCFHPVIPVFVSASEDGTVRMWNNTTFRCESTLNYGLERAWSLCPRANKHELAIGFDEGSVVLKIGSDEPVMSMDRTGKLVRAQGNDVMKGSLKGVECTDGEPVDIAFSELGRCDMFPTSVKHNNNGRYVSILGDGEYVIYTAMKLRNKTFGTGQQLVWSSVATGDYAVRSGSEVHVFREFKESKTIKLGYSPDAIFGGIMLAVVGSKCVRFYDWASCTMVRQIDVTPKTVVWAENGGLVALCCEDAFYVIRCHLKLTQDKLAQGDVTVDGVDGSFEPLHSIPETVNSGTWVGDCFIFVSKNRLNYYVGGEVMSLAHVSRDMRMLGYLAKENRVCLIDGKKQIVTYELLTSVLNYQTAVVREDFDAAHKILQSVPPSKYDQIAQFLTSQGFKEQALQVAVDPDLKFELAIELGKLDLAHGIIVALPEAELNTTPTQHKWKQLGDLALASCNLGLAAKCSKASGDLAGQLIMLSSSGDSEGLLSLGNEAKTRGRFNIAFLCFFLLHRIDDCLALLLEAGRTPEAAFLARTYSPSRVSEMVGLWRQNLEKISKRAAESLADPSEYANLFPDLAAALDVEASLKQKLAAQGLPPAQTYSTGAFAEHLGANLIDAFKASGGQLSASEDASGGSAVVSPSAAAGAAVADSEGDGLSGDEDDGATAAAEAAAAEAAAAAAEAAAAEAAAAEAAAAEAAAAEAAAAEAAAAEAAAAEAAAQQAEADAEAKAAAEAEARAADEAAAQAVADASGAAENGDDDDDDDDFLKEFDVDIPSGAQASPQANNSVAVDDDDDDIGLDDLDLDFE